MFFYSLPLYAQLHRDLFVQHAPGSEMHDLPFPVAEVARVVAVVGVLLEIGHELMNDAGRQWRAIPQQFVQCMMQLLRRGLVQDIAIRAGLRALNMVSSSSSMVYTIHLTEGTLFFKESIHSMPPCSRACKCSTTIFNGALPQPLLGIFGEIVNAVYMEIIVCP